MSCHLFVLFTFTRQSIRLLEQYQIEGSNGEKQYSTVTVVTVQYYCYSVICLARGSLHHPISSPTA